MRSATCLSCHVYFEYEGSGRPHRFCSVCRVSSFRTMLWSRYGLTVHDFDKMLISQSGMCKFCGNGFRKDSNEPHVDHDHETKKVRGLLCTRCNLTVVGLHSRETVEKLFMYFRGEL